MARGLASWMPSLLLLGAALSDEANRSAEDACLGSELGLLIQDQAPECLQTCPSLCPRVVQDITEALRDGRTLQALCAHRGALACATGPEGVEACAPALALAHLPSDLEEFCPSLGGGADEAGAEDQAAEFAAGALARRGGAGQVVWSSTTPATDLESSVAGKEEYPLCVGAPEGQKCVPGNGSEPSVSMVYCTVGKYKLWGPMACSPRYGLDSHCVMTGIGLEVAQCDNPFCRNGGAFHGDGLYCNRGQVVRCVGENAPIVEDDCADFRDQVWENCYRVTERHCVSRSGRNPRCERGGSSWYEGSDCWGV